MGEYWGVESGVGIGLLWHKFQWKDESKESKWKQHTLRVGRCVSTNIYHQSLIIDYVITYWFAYLWCAASYPLSSCWYDDVLWFHPLPSTSLLIHIHANLAMSQFTIHLHVVVPVLFHHFLQVLLTFYLLLQSTHNNISDDVWYNW